MGFVDGLWVGVGLVIVIAFGMWLIEEFVAKFRGPKN